MGYLLQQFFFVMEAFKGHSQSTYKRILKFEFGPLKISYFQINTIIPPVISNAAMITRTVNGSRKNRKG